jgi:pyruvate formate-lyase/glycerol dehydratase family glycyl radical enzyme
MYREKVSDRILKLREQIMERRGSWVHDPNPFERDVAMFRTPKDLSVVQTRAALLHEVVKAGSVRIYPDWRLAGEHLRHGFGFSDPNLSKQTACLSELGIPEAEAPEVEKRVNTWLNERGPFYAIGPVDTEYAKGSGSWDQSMVILASGWIENHSIRDYAKVLRIGFRGIRREIEARMARTDRTDRDFPQQDNFWRAALWVCDAGILLGKRYADLARSMGKPEMAAACDRVPAEGARTLFEATQSLWLAHILTCGEDSINANSLGRLDQILYPYYEADLEAGRITREQAVELMEELACKLYLEYDVQAITLGGVDAAGQSAVNEMSYIILEATQNVDFIRDLSVRLNRHTPKEFVDRCAELVVQGGGIPFFFNEECFIKALTDRGIKLEDARDFSPIGCIELTIPGKANPHAVSGWINSAKCLELALFDGKDPRSGLQLGLNAGSLTDFSSYEEVVTSFRKQLDYFSRNMVYIINRGELAQREKGPLPCWSVLTDDCIDRGRDITDGGAIYNYHSICFLATANVADSLLAIKKLVFEEKKIDREELLAALRANFEGYEPMRQLLLKGVPKYGNDSEEADEIAVWLTNYFIDLMDQFRTPLNGRFFVHLFSFLLNINFGSALGATPDGRRAGEPIAYSLSAQQGRDEKGVTALLNTLAKLPHAKAAGATAAIIDLDPKLVAGEAGVDRLSQIIRTAITMGVGQMQFNVVTSERLRQAQECPEKYGNIPVRVAGYSQMFKLLSKELQEHVIARTKHTN